MRPDGILVKNEDPMYYLIPYFLTKRYDAMNMITLDIPEMPMRAYMNEGKADQPSRAGAHGVSPHAGKVPRAQPLHQRT